MLDTYHIRLYNNKACECDMLFFVCQISIFYSDYTEYATNNYSNSGR